MIASLNLTRKIFTSNSTIGELTINGKFFSHTLEDMDRDKNRNGKLEEGKIYGETAISSGFYQVELTMSNRFKRILPLLLNVEGFEGVRIHNGNYTGLGPLVKTIKNKTIDLNSYQTLEII
jgi:hypothetical protein